jgi:hypothetical protein
MKMEHIVFRNVGLYNSDAGKSPRRKHTPYRTRRKFEIKNRYLLLTTVNIIIIIIVIMLLFGNFIARAIFMVVV